MRYIFLTLLAILTLFFSPILVLGASPKPKTAKPDQPTSGDNTRPQPAADQAPADPKAGDAEKADSDKADSDQANSDPAGADKPKPRKVWSHPTSMAITPEPGGLKALTIHFRWSLYSNSSIEVRLVPGTPNLKGLTVSPINFSEFLKGTVRDDLYTCLDHPSEGGRVHSFTKEKITYTMIGRRNSLGNQGVHVHVYTEDSDGLQQKSPKALPPGARVKARPQLGDSDDQSAYPAAAYLQLDTWAVNQETLSLDLARDEFVQSGTFFVWFFRGDRVVWQEQIRWPGYK